LQQFLFVSEFALGLLDGGDVLGEAEGADDLAALVAQRHLAGEDPHDFALLPDFAFDFADDGFTGADDFLLVLEGRPGVFLGVEIEIGFADQFLGAQTKALG
jgi:hypothetical protein